MQSSMLFRHPQPSLSRCRIVILYWMTAGGAMTGGGMIGGMTGEMTGAMTVTGMLLLSRRMHSNKKRPQFVSVYANHMK